MEDQLRDLVDLPGIRAGVIIVGSVIAATVIEWTIRRLLVMVTRRRKPGFEDVLATSVRRPIFISVVLIGLGWAAGDLPLPVGMAANIDSLLETLAVLMWSAATFRIGAAVLEALSQRDRATAIIQTRTLPVFDMMLKLVVVGAALYFAFLAWRIDLTAWLASAGIVGIAIGFAAKDTLANLFSGIFIIADAPYKIGDFIVLDGGLRGRVTKIGMRSTRVLTLDDIEVTVPNSVIAGSKIINETGGPDIKQRIRVGVDCAYGSDIDKIRAVLLGCPAGTPSVCEQPPPEVRFMEFGASGVRFELRVWIADPVARAAVLDELHCRVYKAFAANRIEIPYTKHDVYIKELPAGAGPRTMAP